jgi:hypothetical protein
MAYSSICVEEPTKNAKELNRKTRFPARDFNPEKSGEPAATKLLQIQVNITSRKHLRLYYTANI